MIDGINILAEDIVLAESTWGWHPVAIITIGSFLIGLIVLIFGSCLSEKHLIISGLICMIMGVIATLGILSSAKDYYKYQYYCIIDNNINFKEFYNKYEVVKQIGDNLYIIEPKEQEYFEQKGE